MTPRSRLALRRDIACAVAAAACACALHAEAAPRGNPLDPLTRPSVLSARADTVLMSAVHHAGSRLVAVGLRGTILTSDDEGATWTQRPSPVSVMLTNVRFADARSGWAVGHGGVVLATADGGDTWRVVLDGRKLATLAVDQAKAGAQALDAPDQARRAMAWAEALVADGPDKPWFDLLTSSDRGLFVVGAFGLAMRSVDGGENWSDWAQRIPNPQRLHLYGICAAGDTVFVAGEQGLLARSRDGGQHFEAVGSPYAGSFFGALCLSPEHVVIFGLKGNAYVSTDGGATWSESETKTNGSISAGTALEDGSIVLVSQAGNVLRSTDGGNRFERVDVQHPVPYIGVTQATDQHIVLAGLRGMTSADIVTSSAK